MYSVYVLENQADLSWYIGYTSNLRRRLSEHLEGRGGRTTRLKKNWRLIYHEGYLVKRDALGRELFLKSGSGRKYIQRQLHYYFKTRNTKTPSSLVKKNENP